ncbi:MAG: PQQ-binding-like beta-propeller repeat protein [Candidatus Brocadiia bacterium]
MHPARRAAATGTFLLAALAGPLCPCRGGEAAARRLLEESGIRGGLVVHVGGASPQRTAALRASSRFIVQGLERDPAAAAAARATLARRGLEGPVSVVRWDGERLPYAANTVSLLVVETPEDLDRAEMRRVLAPGGVAYVRADGRWRREAKPWPEDIDDWTHFLHGPDNNAVARDRQVAPPRHLQWVAGPRWARSHDHLASLCAAVSAGGRLFAIVDEGPIASVAAPPEWRLVARDAFGGVLLWKRPVEPWEDPLRPFRSGPAELPRRLVAVGDRVYVTLGYGQPVTALDAATGQTLRTYEGTANTHEILCSEGKLFLVVSAPLEEESPTTGEVLRRMPLWRGAYAEYVVRYKPKHIRAVDAHSGELAWKREGREFENVLPLSLAVGGGRVFFQNPTHLVALDAGSGEVLWRAERPVVRHRYAWQGPTVVVQDGVVLSADRSADKPVPTRGEEGRLEWLVSANHLLAGGELRAFSAATGEPLWTAPCHEGFNSPPDVLVASGKVWSGVLAWGRQPGLTQAYDLLTGEVAARRPPDAKTYTIGMGHHRCYRNKATSQYVIQGRSGVEFLDVSSDRAIADHWVRGGCQYGVLPANGLLYAPPHSCACYIAAKLNGFNALSGRRARPFDPQPDRLEKGPAYAQAAPQGQPADEDAWPTYRHDPARSGATEAPLSPQLETAWERALPGPLTAITVAGGRAYVAQREAHTLHAVDAADGSPLWRYTAGGRVDSPPTVHRGLVLFGSADGWVTCLRARDGAVAWRFRAAPEARQLVAYDQLESVWPVPGNVLVCQPAGRDHPVAYLVAGRGSYVDGGMHLYGLHPRTGEVVVERRIDHRDPQTGLEPQEAIRGVTMPGALPDVMSTDGASVFLRHLRFGFDGESLPADVPHLFTATGFLDATWWHRTYWQVGTSMGCGYGGWRRAGNRRVSGRLLVVAGERAFGFGRTGYEITGSHLGLRADYRLFAARVGAGKKALWARPIPFYVRAMALAADTLFIAGPSDIADLDAAQPESPVHLWALAAADGTPQAEHRLSAAPVFDSFAVAPGRLYLATADGRVVCLRGR